MGYSASATLTYGYDVTNQSPKWFDNEDMDDFGEYGTRMLTAADPHTYVRLARDEHIGTTILAAAWHHAGQGEVEEIPAMELPLSVYLYLEQAASILEYDISDLKPCWRLTAKFD